MKNFDKKKYQREWVRKRRNDWFTLKGACAHCGSLDRLCLDHVDPSTKITHLVWSRSKEFRDAELAKCQVLCLKCHIKKTSAENSIKNKGVQIKSAQTVPDYLFHAVERLKEDGISYRSACKQVGIKYTTFSSAKACKRRIFAQ